jgi:ribosomal protein S27E
MDKTIDFTEDQNKVNTCEVCGFLGFGDEPKPKGAQGDFITVRYECPRCHNTWTACYGFAFRIRKDK